MRYEEMIFNRKVLISLANREVAVSMRDVTKTFGTVKANNKVNLDIYRGEILSLLGENGSGKTTLMNMLSGIYFPDEGQIFINGKEEVIKSPKDALRLGIGMVHQHFKLIDVFSVLDNIILGAEDTKLGFLQKKKARQKVSELSDRYGRLSVSFVSTVPTYFPFRSTVTRSETAMISLSLCEIKRIDFPSAVRFFIICINSSISWGVSTAVGSSKIRISLSR